LYTLTPRLQQGSHRVQRPPLSADTCAGSVQVSSPHATDSALGATRWPRLCVAKGRALYFRRRVPHELREHVGSATMTTRIEG